MRKFLMVGLVVALFTALTALPALATPGNSSNSNGRPGSEVQVYVTSQGLYYDSIVKTDLPQHGNFQQLIPVEQSDGTVRLETEFGPGAPGHLGGRWWVDANGDGMQNEGDAFFLCPLLGPGSTTP